MISKIKDFLGFDIKAEKYKLSHDDTFGMISDANKPDKGFFQFHVTAVTVIIG